MKLNASGLLGLTEPACIDWLSPASLAAAINASLNSTAAVTLSVCRNVETHCAAGLLSRAKRS